MRYSWASGIGHRASGIGHRASGIGHRAYLTTLENRYITQFSRTGKMPVPQRINCLWGGHPART
ncbi:hypothetical protein [Microcoleus sp. T2B6]|uniref:hypothetical protein n=1 Tax=Microcoleus sp. T2B6 TaxID=3055424 RepID=UPI002FD14F05